MEVSNQKRKRKGQEKKKGSTKGKGERSYHVA